ncbi:MAG: hypothetical protein KatS3mg002_1391 [Candidatus Woesearchaeota archaeon]|nr:MAG: hypothetical protein KatS3mg002_1391 [Candidatus Woesearchaeota archaeon]
MPQKYPNFPKPEIDEEYAIVDFIKNLPLRYEILIQEFPLYNSEYAGTPDMILLNKFTENIVILDWKTGNNLLKNYKNTKLKSPFQNYVDCPLHRYSIQLSLYKMLIEQKTPLKVEECWLIHLDKDKWIKHNALDLTKELIKHYDERKKFSSLL